jgi:exonuclease III
LGENILKIDKNLYVFQNLEDYPHKFWYPAEKEGYSGIALFSKEKPIHVQV